MTANVSVCIPCAPYHSDIVQRAIDSVEAQTVATNKYWTVDEDGNGPGVLRNLLLRHVETPYVVFLDADDWLAPTFVEECLRVIKPGRYVYTDWYNPVDYRHGPDHPYCYKDYLQKTWHMITALLHTQDVRQVSGFDENLSALEDTDFWLRMTRIRGVCGIRLQKALVYYGEEGQRAQKAKDEGIERPLLDDLLAKYEDMPMPCCGQNASIDQSIPVGERQPNDVLVTPRWHGNRPEYGRATRRRYPRVTHGNRLWVDRRDVQMKPDHWEEIIEPAVDQTPGLEALVQLFHNPKGTPDRRYEIPPDAPPEFTPDVDRITQVAQERLT